MQSEDKDFQLGSCILSDSWSSVISARFSCPKSDKSEDSYPERSK